MNRSEYYRGWAILPILAVTALTLLGVSPTPVRAHCDTLNGPVVIDAKKALDTGDLTPVLKWINADEEPEIRAAFDKTLSVRKGTPAARDLADQWFFETLVRVHRAGEGEPYTGLKPAGMNVDPGIEAADDALDTGSIDPLIRELTNAIDANLRSRFQRAAHAAHEKDTSVAAGREYVEAYVQFIHFVERLHQAASAQVSEEHHHTEE